MVDIVIAIPTFKRPVPLAAALEAVLPQARDLSDAVPGARATVLVVDNDPNEGGRPIAASFDVRYAVEPTPGIAAVRNRSIAESADADAVLFIDDDEVPEPGWLEAIARMYTTTSCDAVAGRVVTSFPPDAEPWVRASGAFIRPVRRDGQLMREAATNNLLLDLTRVRELGLSFDERFGLTGGSDSMFTRQFTQRGGKIRWAQDAVVIEQEDPARFTREWVLMRTFRFGNTAARVDIATAGSSGRRLVARIRTVARGGVRVVAGGLRWVWGAVTGSLSHRARGLRTLYRGGGMVTGAVGYAHDEYSRRHTSAT